jgi:hypothetical protein
MAITKTRAVKEIQVLVVEPDSRVNVIYEWVFDDTEDDSLPATTYTTKNLSRYVEDPATAGDPTQVPTDISGEDALVQTICNMLWTD